MKMNGELILNHVESKKILDAMRMLAKGKTAPIEDVCAELAEETDDYHQMDEYSNLLKQGIRWMIVYFQNSKKGSIKIQY